MKVYILECGHLPDKHVVEKRALLSWAKYQRKKIKEGTLDAEKRALLYGKAKKDDVRELIWDKLSPVLNEKQKASNKIQNLLSSLRIAGKIEFKQGFWVIKL